MPEAVTDIAAGAHHQTCRDPLLSHGTVIADPAGTAAAVNRLFGGGLNEAPMVAVADAELFTQRFRHRRRRG